MEPKIIELTKSDDNYQCLVCCANPATNKMKINRLVLDDCIISFSICNECLAKMQKEIEIYKS